MATYRKTRFPNYLNRPRLFIYWETDEIAFVLGITAFLTIGLFVFSFPTYILVPLVAIAVPFSHHAFIKLTKDKAPNWLNHFLYSKGLSKGVAPRDIAKYGKVEKKKCFMFLKCPVDDKTIPSSHITVFEEM